MSADTQIELSLVVDRAAAASRPDEAAIRDWAADQRVFLSSVIEGYGDYREAAAAAVKDIGAEPVWFERFGGRDADPNEAYLAEVRSSSIYVGLLGARYGRPLADRYSATHQEFREAERTGVRTSVWVQEEVDREGPQQSFVDEIRVFDVTGGFATPEELRRALTQRLLSIAAEEMSPWVKLGSLVFRANEIHERSGVVVVRAVVREPTVSAALRALDDHWGRRHMLLSYGDRTAVAEVQSVGATTRASRAVEFELEASVADPPVPTRVNYNGVDWDELTKLAIEVSFFGAANPFGLMGSVAEISNPFAVLRSAGISEESIRPIARLMVSEILVVERGIDRLTRFQLGRPIRGRRRLRLGVQVPAPYTNQPAPPPFEVEGDVEA